MNPEMKYHQGTLLAACGEKQIAFAFLRQAVAGNYCAHQALQSDPLLASVRGDPEFRADCASGGRLSAKVQRGAAARQVTRAQYF